MEKKQFVQKAITIASFVKKNKHLFEQSSNSLSQFLCDELGKCKYGSYTYHLDNAKIQFFLNPYNSDGRNGGYLCCNVINLNNWDVYPVFSSDETNVKYYYYDTTAAPEDIYSIFDIIFNDVLNREEERTVLFVWDKIIKCIERYYKDIEEDF